MNNRAIATASAPAAIGPYSQGVAAEGISINVSGQLGLVPETGEFETRTLKGMLELVSLSGNVIRGEDGLCHHTHAVFCFKDGERHCVAGGHIKSITVLYTAEIELRPVAGGVIRRRADPETGTGFWSFQ